MGVQGAVFSSGGQISTHYIPGAYSRLDFIKGVSGLVSVNRAVAFGDCRGGEPGKILWFSGPTEAEEVLRDGPLLDYVKHAFSPGRGLVPQAIGAWRVNPGTPAAYSFLKTATEIFSATAWDYGLHTNQLKIKLEAGTTSGKKVTIQFQDNTEEVADNIEAESFQIQYTGAGSAATMAISKTALTTVVTGGPGGEDLNVVFTSFPRIQDVVNYINDQSAYTCTVISGSETDNSNELDKVTAQDILTSAYTAHSDLQALMNTIESSPWIGSVTFNAAADRELPDNLTSWTYFTGATDGAYTSTEWTAALSAALLEDIQFVGTPSEDASVHASIKAHCATANSVEGKAERQFIVGGAAGETVTQALTRAANLNSEYGMLCYPGFVHYDFDNLSATKTWSPAYFAAKVFGAQVALAVPEPATNKTVDALSWESDLSRSDQNSLIQGGVCCGALNRAGRLVTVRTVTTFQGNLLQQNEFSMMRIALLVSRDLRTSVEESFVGHALSKNSGVLAKIDGIAMGKLSQYYDEGMFNGEPPYWGYKKEIVGDQIKIEYDCNITPPTNFIFITSHMHVYASTAA